MTALRVGLLVTATMTAIFGPGCQAAMRPSSTDYRRSHTARTSQQLRSANLTSTVRPAYSLVIPSVRPVRTRAQEAPRHRAPTRQRVAPAAVERRSTSTHEPATARANAGESSTAEIVGKVILGLFTAIGYIALGLLYVAARRVSGH